MAISANRTIRLLAAGAILCGFVSGMGQAPRADTEPGTPQSELQELPDLIPDLAPDAVAVTDPGAIQDVLNDLTIYGRYFDGENWIEYHEPDGRTAYHEKGCTYPGKWWVEESTICYAYPNYRNNTPNCFLMFLRPNGGIQFIAFAADGTPYLASTSTKTAPGNDAHLPLGNLSPCVGV